MDELEVMAFRQRARTYLFERLAIQTAFQALMLGEGLSIQQAHVNLSRWLDSASKKADEVYGAHFQDPAMTALYADEWKAVTETIKGEISAYADDLLSRG
jgi:hypothetical protein